LRVCDTFSFGLALILTFPVKGLRHLEARSTLTAATIIIEKARRALMAKDDGA